MHLENADSSMVTHDAVRIRISKKRVYVKRFNIRNFRQIFFKQKFAHLFTFEIRICGRFEGLIDAHFENVKILEFSEFDVSR